MGNPWPPTSGNSGISVAASVEMSDIVLLAFHRRTRCTKSAVASRFHPDVRAGTSSACLIRTFQAEFETLKVRAATSGLLARASRTMQSLMHWARFSTGAQALAGRPTPTAITLSNAADLISRSGIHY
jgi:hypothetical protein